MATLPSARQTRTAPPHAVPATPSVGGDGSGSGDVTPGEPRGDAPAGEPPEHRAGPERPRSEAEGETEAGRRARDGSGHGPGGPGPGTVVIGATTLARRVCASLEESGHPVDHLAAPDDQDLRRALAARPAGVAVLVGDDLSALRYALAVRHVCDTVRIVVTVFDRTVAQQLRLLLRHCVPVSPADLLAPTLAGLCVDPDALAVWDDGHGAVAVRRPGEQLVETAWRASTGARRRALLGRLRGQLQPHDADARLLLIGLLGIVAVLAADWMWLVAVFHQPVSTAFLEAARVVAGVGPAAPHPGHPVYEVVSAVAMLVTVGFTALLTAGIVDRLFGPRLVGVLGPRVLPGPVTSSWWGWGRWGWGCVRRCAGWGCPSSVSSASRPLRICASPGRWGYPWCWRTARTVRCSRGSGWRGRGRSPPSASTNSTTSPSRSPPTVWPRTSGWCCGPGRTRRSRGPARCCPSG